MRNLTIFCLLSFIYIGSAAAQDTAPTARTAVERALSAYHQGGLTQIKTASENCYTRDPDEIYCIYLDTAAQQIDGEAANELGTPRSDYFQGAQFLERARPAFLNAGLNMQESNAFLRLCYEEVSAEMRRARARGAPTADL